jgi:hypothetical protein
MSEFKVNLTVEVDQVANALAIQTPVPIQLAFDGGRWQATCSEPSMITDEFESFDEAMIVGARQVATEMQAAVYDRPVILARITPDDVPAEWF